MSHDVLVTALQFPVLLADVEPPHGAGPASSAAGMFTTTVWLTPLILLPGVALLVVSTSARFGQLHAEFHRLLDHPDSHSEIVARHLLRRCAFFRDALVALYASVGLFALGSLLGGVVNLWRPESLWVVGGATIVGIGCLGFAAVQLLRESFLSLRVIVDHLETLRRNTPHEDDSAKHA